MYRVQLSVVPRAQWPTKPFIPPDPRLGVKVLATAGMTVLASLLPEAPFTGEPPPFAVGKSNVYLYRLILTENLSSGAQWNRGGNTLRNWPQDCSHVEQSSYESALAGVESGEAESCGAETSGGGIEA